MRVALTGGAYTARSVIAGAQRCVNLYPEMVPQPQGEPAPTAHYPTPGLVSLATPPSPAAGRGLCRASSGQLFAIVGSTVYAVSSGWGWTALGTIAAGATPVSMADNGTTLVLVDGSTAGYTVDLSTLAFGAIGDSAFYGADRVDFSDTYFLFNKPGTPQFYISGSQAVTFDPLDFADKTSSADSLVGVVELRSEIWLLGELFSEVWINSGASDFTFQRLPAGVIEHGCCAKYSIAKQDASVFWLSQDRAGEGIVLMGGGIEVKRISTHAIEAEFGTYATLSDAVGFSYQQGGHVFYVLTFPTADKTWVFDASTGLWHERMWLDDQGVEHRHRGAFHAFAYGANVVQDWQTGALYRLDPDAYDDAGQPIRRVRSFPHMLADGRRVMYRQFIADMEVGTVSGVAAGQNEPQVFLRWSDSRGQSWGNPVGSSLGATGAYQTSIQFQRLGMARDRVFELSWSASVRTALLGAFIDAKPAGT